MIYEIGFDTDVFKWFKDDMTEKMEDVIAKKLAQALQPFVMDIVNESHKHAGHAGDNGSGESHFLVKIVSDMFIAKSRIERQRMVYDILEDEMRGRIHALSIKAMTRDEYVGMP